LRAHIVVDLGFGDAGKGLLTDFLVRHFDASIVVRYNGGAQAGHNVVTADGRHHTFSQFGSGSFIPRVKTYLSRHVVIHPTALLVEGDLLQAKSMANPFSRLRISDQALVITPFHQALNRVREKMRGAGRHGSCGVGVGEAVEDSMRHPDSRILAGDLLHPEILRHKAQAVRERMRDEATALLTNGPIDSGTLREFDIFNRKEVTDNWITALSRMRELGLVMDDLVLRRWLGEAEDVVFEGAQGVLLDGDAGFHPYTTWSNCTMENAIDLIREMAPNADVSKVGVLRSYAVRHGPGPLPTETDELRAVIAEHNQFNEWQGTVRYGWFDAVLARYALGATGGVDHLAVTHMDILPHLKEWNFCQGYRDPHRCFNTMSDSTISGNTVTTIPAQNLLLLSERAQITQALSKIEPVIETCDAEDEIVIQKIEALLEHPVGMFSHGPSAENVQLLNSAHL
jgi:adenylosuccinate synthase